MLLHIFYYIPFSTRPEHLFIDMKNRFFRFTQMMLERGRKQQEGQESWLVALSAKYSEAHLMSTVKKMQLWANGVDTKYFDTIDKEKLLAFTKEAEKFSYLVWLLYHRDLMMKNNPLIQIMRKNYTLPYLSDLLREYAKGKEVKDVDTFWRDKQQTVYAIEESLSKVLENIDFELYTRKDIAQLYENISLRRNVWLSLFNSQELMEELNFSVLKRSRF